MTTLRGRTHRGRAKPGRRGGGKFFHIEVRRPQNFVSFRVQDVNGKGSASAPVQYFKRH